MNQFILSIKKAANNPDRFSAAFYVNLKDPSTPLRSAQDDNKGFCARSE